MALRAIVVYALLMAVIGSIGCWVVSCGPPTTQVDLEAAAQGKQLYHALACDSCHGLDAVGSTRTYAPTHNHLRATAEKRIRAADYTGQATTAAEYIRESIVDPNVYVVDGYQQVRFGMASFAHLSEREVKALIHFLLQQE